MFLHCCMLCHLLDGFTPHFKYQSINQFTLVWDVSSYTVLQLRLCTSLSQRVNVLISALAYI